MLRSHKAGLILCVIAAATSNLNAQGDDCSKRTVAVNVRDKSGQLVAGLLPSSFRAREEGHPLNVLKARIDVGPRRVVLAVDASGSINRSLEVARLVASNLALQSPNGFQIALIIFSGQIVDSIQFGRPATDIVEKLAQLQTSKGRTAIKDALMHAAEMFGTPQLGDSIYVITDGGDQPNVVPSEAGYGTTSVKWIYAHIRELYDLGANTHGEGSHDDDRNHIHEENCGYNDPVARWTTLMERGFIVKWTSRQGEQRCEDPRGSGACSDELKW